MSAHQNEVRETRDRFLHWHRIPTRYSDCDTNGHVNNALYYSYFDTLIVHCLTSGGNLNMDAPVVPFCVENHCRYYAPFHFPQTIDAGLRVSHIGNSSARYEIGLFAENESQSAAQGYFVHVKIPPGGGGR